MNTKKLCAIAAFFILNTVLVFGQAEAYELREAIGMKGSSAENYFKDEGYHLEKVNKSNAGIYQNWWNGRKRKCITVRLDDGRVESVVNSQGDCGSVESSHSSNSHHSSSRNNGKLNLYSLSGMSESSAFSELQDHGYRVKNQYGTSILSMYWHKKSNDKCLLMMVKNGRVTSVTKMSDSRMCKGNSNSGSSYNNNNRHHGNNKYDDDNGVTLYGDCSFKGSHRTLRVGRYDHDELGVGNDKVSSIRVPRGYRIIIYQDGGWRGGSKTLYEDNGCLEHGWNDHISSVKVERD
ncbi:hypothetical protein F6U93_12540 [Tamlana haliotis]|uniref:Beta/gamma crystallin 'Greek key' domain-containing protein n=1 Tax=Pseudotamlana haliotis TaxID=2614804 RepID=A0A6N6MC70_9FLAO|nr:hypothetical protein [Tamlana haliotis]KAB1067240.1 hypothetical protein F6U93_12540 [Tamlana haliotis]